MTKKAINAKEGPSYPLLSHAIKVDKTIYCSGQVARAQNGEIVGKGDIEAQVNQAFYNLKAVLKTAGATLNDVVKVTIYLKTMGDKPKVAEARKRNFTGVPPATTLIEVNSLADPDLLIEIDAIAVSE